MNKKHIVVNCWNYPQEGQRGNPYLYDLFLALSKHGHKVTLVDMQFWGIGNFLNFLKPISKFKKTEGVEVYIIPILNLFPYFDKLFPVIYRLWIKFLMQRKIKLYVKNNGKPDFIQHHFILNSPPFYTEYWSSLLKIPYVVFEHSFNVKLSDIQKRMLTKGSVEYVTNFVKRAAFRIARTNYAKTFYEEIYNYKFLVIPNFITESDIPPPFKEKENTNFVFIIVGSLIKRKAQELAIEAFAQKFKTNEFELWIVGGGERKDYYESLIKQYNAENRINMLGELPKTHVLQLINQANVLLVTSENETFGNTILEAFYFGKPVISTKCGGPQELINENNGLLCNHNTNDIANAMEIMVENYKNYNSEIIKEKVKRLYSKKVIMQKIETLYNEIV